MSSRLIVLRGGGDLATGVAARLFHCGFDVVVTEIAQPLAVRRLVALSEAVYRNEVVIEDLRGRLVESAGQALQTIKEGVIPVLVDPSAESCNTLQPLAVVDCRMLKRAPESGVDPAPFVVGLGPGFTAGMDCHVVIETNRGHYLGRVIREGTTEKDTGVPGKVGGQAARRVLRAPVDGILQERAELGTIVKEGDIIAEVDGQAVRAPFDGALRGLLPGGTHVTQGLKIGDVDPRGDVKICSLISEKSLAIAGGVLEALLSQPGIRTALGQ
ncbi:MAG: EF2563 family selenium-dependent molybdenum hydroxylase system protein [Anaerolineales bacterium]|nr:EF2563 family selenium-dependent molybdenum hydroxylase system protein [Anaerolineales bacterium]